MGVTYTWVKRAMDVGVSAVGLATLAPFMSGIAVLVRATSPGPILFRQERIGLHGKPFRILKFRTMVSGADSRGASITAGGDARVTPVGRALRAYKLDELPQLLNVLRGEMSLVGPRPEVRRFVECFPDAYAEILRVKPGITDFAAIEYRDEEGVLAGSAEPERTYVDEVLPKKIALYQRYIRDRSLVTDVSIVIRTFWAVLR